MIELEDANKIMEKVNYTYNQIKDKMYEFDTKRMHDKKAGLIYERLLFAHIEMSKLLGEVEKVILE